jgi:methylated-DNA-[protein]-cysteine S-methyltransferase
MSSPSYSVFDTPVGRCGIVWGARGVVGLQLPEGRDPELRRRVLTRWPGATEAPRPKSIERAVSLISALLRGEPSDLSAIGLDMEDVPPFHRRVYEAARAIHPGETVTYGALAARIGASGSARAVGQALGKNPFAIIVPCHRVLAAGGKVGGFSANVGTTTKLRLLGLECAADRAPLFAGDGALPFNRDAAVEHLCAADTALARLIERVGPFRMQLKTTSSVFAALAEAIVYQQLTGKAAATIFARVCGLFPRAHHGLSPERLLELADEELQSAGLSRSKRLSLQDLAKKTIDGHIPELSELQRMADEAIIERLSKVRGIGRWTVEMLLIFRLGRPDILPVDDYGVRKGFAVAFKKPELPSRAELAKRGARWKPYRSVASWYLWRAVELAKSRPAPRRA